MAVVDDYFLNLDAANRDAFERVRRLAIEVAPQAEQGMSYGVVALLLDRKPLIGFAAAKDHLSVFPFSSRVVDAVRDQLVGYRLSKGTVRFTAVRPLPDEVVRELVRLRMAEIGDLQ